MSVEGVIEPFWHALLEDDPVQLYERAPCGYLSTAPDGTIVKVNQTFLSWTGYSEGDLVGRRRFSELLTVGGRIYHETHFAPMLAMQGHAREIALDIVRADGSRLPVLVNTVLERTEDGTPIIARTAVFDATERRRYEMELLRARERAEASEERARALARTLQQTFVPPAPPDIPDLDVGTGYRPAGDGSEVGGDFHDVFQLGPSEWAITLGDVCGKGVDAAVVTALVRFAIRGAAVRHERPADVLRTVNEAVLRHGTSRFCTALFVRLRQVQPHDGNGNGDEGGDPAARESRGRRIRWVATVAAAGHPLPVLAREGGAMAHVGRHGSLLGVLPEPRFHEVDVELTSGDTLVLFSDGVTEARRNGTFADDRLLRERLGGTVPSASELATALVDDVVDYQDGDTRDDVALVVVHVP